MMKADSLRPQACPISADVEARRLFVYEAPPAGEIGFRRSAGAPYYREVWQFEPSGHCVSCHAMAVDTQYDGAYVDATYQDDAGMLATFNRIIGLPPDKSDNAGRIARITAFADVHFGAKQRLRVLDVGAGLGVFPYVVRQAGWSCTAIDPDPRAARHIRDRVGVEAICGDFMQLEVLERFDIVTFNKVLEHVLDPIAMLRKALSVLTANGVVYLELPDAEMAQRDGAGREEFFIEHLHIFSLASTALLARRGGFATLCLERLREPSSKFTLRAFLRAQ